MKKCLFVLWVLCIGLLTSCSEETFEPAESTAAYNEPSSEVRMYSEADASYVIEEPTETSIVFSGSTPDYALPKVGEVILMPESENTPFGFLGRVLKVDVGDKITVTTEIVPLEEAFPNLSIDVGLTKVKSYGIFDEDGNPVDYYIEDVEEDTVESNPTGNRYAKNKDEDPPKIIEFDWEKKQVTIPIPESWVKMFTKEDIDLDGVLELSFEGTNIAKIDNKNGEAKYIDVDIRPRLTVGAKMTGHIKQVGDDGKKKWETKKLTYKGAVWIGAVCFPITIPIWLKAQLEGDFSTSVEVRYNKYWRLHYVYKDKKWSRQNDEVPAVDKTSPWYITEFDASGKFSVGPDFEVNVGVYTSKVGLGMEFYPNAYLKAEANLSSLDPFAFNPEAEVGIGLEWRAYCRAELFGKKVEPFSIDLPDVPLAKLTLSLFPNISEFSAIGGSNSADLSWRSDSYYLLEPLGVKAGATLFMPDGAEKSFYPSPSHTDMKGQRYYNKNVTGLQSGTTYMVAPTIAFKKWKWHGEKQFIETEGKYHLAFRCTNHDYDVIEFDFDLNNKTGNVIDYTTEAQDYDGSPMRVHITATYNSANKTLNGTFDFFFYNDPDQKRKDGFSVSLATDDSGYVDCSKIIDNGGCYAALRIFKVGTPAAMKRYLKPLVYDDCNIGIFNKHYKR